MIYMKIPSHIWKLHVLLLYAYKNVNILTRTGFLQYHHGFSLSRDINERFYPWGQMLYFRFGYRPRKWGLLLDYKFCRAKRCCWFLCRKWSIQSINQSIAAVKSIPLVQRANACLHEPTSIDVPPLSANSRRLLRSACWWQTDTVLSNFRLHLSLSVPRTLYVKRTSQKPI